MLTPMHPVRYLNNVPQKWSTFEGLLNTVARWKLLGEQLWQGVRAPLGELTCNQCSKGLKDDKSLYNDSNFACAYTAQGTLHETVHTTTPVYLSGTLGNMPTRSVFRGRCHCCLICAH